MAKQKANYFRILFVAIVIIAVISGSIAFFAPVIETPGGESPSGFFFSFFRRKPVTFEADAGADQVAQVNSKITLDSSASTGRMTYYTWQIKEPDGKIITKIGRGASFTPEQEGNYIVTLKVFYGKKSDTDNLTVTVLPKLDFQRYQSKLKTLQIEERTSKTTSGIRNKKPVANILLIYPTSATEGETIRFLAYGYDPDGKIKNYYWYVGRKIVSKENSFTATKIVPGVYDFVLVIWDDKGATDIAIQRVVVKPIDKRKVTPLSSEGISLWEIE